MLSVYAGSHASSPFSSYVVRGFVQSGFQHESGTSDAQSAFKNAGTWSFFERNLKTSASVVG